MACRYTYQGKTYEAWEFEDLLKAMPPGDAALFMPTVKPIPEAPFVGKTDAWLQLALKRVMGLAVDGGYDAVAFVNGQQSADRYDLSKQVEAIDWIRRKDGTYDIAAYPKGGGQAINKDRLSTGEVADMIGKDLADRITKEKGEPLPLEWADATGTMRGLDLKVGGAGMITFYDEIVPNAVKALTKRVGSQLEAISIPDSNAGREVVAAMIPGNGAWGVYDRQKGQWLSSWNQETYASDPDDAELMSERAAKNIASAIMRDAGVMLEQPGFLITDDMRSKLAGGMPLFSARFTEAADKAGFDTSKVWYHGTTAKVFKNFRPGNGGVDELGTGIYFTGDPGVAGAWAGRPDQGGRIIPAYVRKGEIFDSSKPVDYLALARRIKDRNPVSDDERRARQIRSAKSVTEWTPEEQRLINRADSELWRSWLQESDEDMASQIRRGSLNAWLDRAGYIGRKNDRSQIKDQVVIFRPENIRAPWSKFSPKKSGSADYLASARVEPRGFEVWSEGLPVIENEGDYGGGPAVFVAYHGTTHSNITEFLRAGSKEGFLGQGPYFTTSPDDASSNYAGIGPDLRGRIDLEAEQIVDSMEDDRDFGMEVLQEYIDDQKVEADLNDDTYEDIFNEHAGDAAEHRARKQLKGDSDGLVMKSFVKLANPLDTVNGELTYQTVEDENGDVTDETGTLVDWIVAAREVAGYRGLDREVESYIDALLSDGDGVSASKVLSAAVKHLNGAYDDSGESVSAGQIVSEIAEQLGYDGIIMDAGEYFGGRRAGPFGIRQKAMAGVTDGTLHIVPFSPNQVKSATGNSGAFSRTDNDIRRSARVADDAFEPELISRMSVPDYKSREKLIDMPIADFLALAEDGRDGEKLINARRLLWQGAKFNSLPFLMIDENGRVDGHEGRHRARALAEQGYTSMPVILRMANLRWSEQADPDRFDYREDWPTEIQAQKGAANPDLSVPFPVSREEAMQPYGSTVMMSGRIKKESLPEDMQDILMSFYDEFNMDVPESLVVRQIPLSSFPDVRLADGVNDERGEAYAIEMIGEETPPIIVHGSDWLDGRHRVWAAKRAGNSSIDAIDISHDLPKDAINFIEPIGVLATNPSYSARTNSARVTETPEFKHLSALLGSSGMTGLMQSLRNKTIVDGLKRNAQALSDLLESHPGLSEQGRLIDIPTSVVGHVVKVVDDEQIRRAVVATLPVDVVNLLGIKQLSADQVLSDKAMLENVLSIDGASDVSLAIDKAGAKSLLRSVAIQATELAGLADRLLKSGPAGLANAGDSVFRAHSGSVTETEAFSKWFGDSKVVDANGKPLVVYHGTPREFKGGVFKRGFQASGGSASLGFHFGTMDAAHDRILPAIRRQSDLPNLAEIEGIQPSILPVYLRVEKPLRLEDIGSWHKPAWVNRALEKAGVDAQAPTIPGIKRRLQELGYDGIVYANEFEGRGKFRGSDTFMTDDSWIAFEPSQIKSAIGNRGTFDPKNPDIRYSARTNSAWGIPENTWFDDFVFKTQDKLIDLKRVTEAIRKSAGKITDDINAYLQEELFHGRAAKRVEDFGRQELEPLMKAIGDAGLTIADVEEYLHARHAPEANRVIAERNPDNPGLQDGGSGMKTADAQAYMAALPADVKRKLESVAAKVDKIIGETRQLYVSYGLEDQAVVDGWGTMFQHYIPLQREDKEGGMGIGQGFSVKGKETKGRTGSTRKVVDILANIALQRERLIVRGEKNRVAQALVGMAWANPNEDFWEVRSQAPTERVYDPKTNKVVERPDNMFKNQPNVLTAKVKDSQGNVTEQAIVFNPDNQRAMRLAAAMKNIDAGNLEGLLSVGAKITRYFAAINTQYNPVFGVVNLVRDVQGALINLGGTPLADQRAAIAADTMKALVGIYGDLRKTRAGGQATSSWAKLWEEFQDVGGKTGYRDMFRNSAERAEGLQEILTPDGWMDSPWGKVFTANGTLKVPMSAAKKGAEALFSWLSDYNEAMENGVRLAAYKAALDKGMTQKQAASLAKNLTVNFNRKGQIGMQMGAVYAFFNAAMQGTARIGQTLFTMDGGDIKTLRLNKTGKTVVYGGVLLGSMQALMLAAAGFDDEDPPEFTRERSLVIPTGGKTYVSIPMPLGLHVIPGIGRHLTEFILSGGDKPAQRAISIFGMFADAFNPIGNAGLSMQTLAPTVFDPMVALTENKDWAGRPIARTSMNEATPGHTLHKDTASTLAKLISEGINAATGGSEYVAGALSPTPDQIDYLIGQVTGGVGRELSKVEQSALATMRGEELPTYKIPLVGRFVGNASGQASEGSAFYANSARLNELETEVKGLRADGKNAEAQKLLASRPDAYLITVANTAERQIQRLRKEKRKLIEDKASREQVRAVEEQITAAMARLNRAVEKAEAAKR